MKVPVKPQSDGTHHVDHHIALHERVLEGKGLIIGKNIRVSTNEDGQYILDATPGTAGGTEAWPPVIYDIGSAYSVGDWVWVQASDTIVNTGEIYPPTGLTALSKSGPWRCVKDAPAGYFPVAPYPTPDDPTAANMYWLYFGNLFC